jgi:hypothetical protein
MHFAADIGLVIKPGVRTGISNVLRSGKIPEHLKNDPAACTV